MTEQLCIHELIATECGICNGAAARESLKRAPAAQGYADVIFDLIPVDDEGPVSKCDLADKAGLSEAQVAAGVAYLRDNYPELPLVSDGRGYSFTLNEADINRFRLARQRSALTIYRRLWRGVIKPWIEKSVERGQIGRTQGAFITKQFERLLEDLEGMVAA